MLKIIRSEFDGHPGLELAELDDAATIADLFIPLQHAADDSTLPKLDHKARYARCAGCANNCCRRYAILPDLLTVRKLQQHFKLDISAFAERFLRLDEDQPFAEFRGRGCPFLREELCTIYSLRPAFCRFYLCVPCGERLEKLKAQVLLLGEAALREHLVAQGIGPETWLSHATRQPPELREWPGINHLLHTEDYAQITLRECCSERLWTWLQLPEAQTRWQTYAQWLQHKGDPTGIDAQV